MNESKEKKRIMVDGSESCIEGLLKSKFRGRFRRLVYTDYVSRLGF